MDEITFDDRVLLALDTLTLWQERRGMLRSAFDIGRDTRRGVDAPTYDDVLDACQIWAYKDREELRHAVTCILDER